MQKCRRCIGLPACFEKHDYLGSSPGDLGSPPGSLSAYDVRTGRGLDFHTIPTPANKATSVAQVRMKYARANT